MNQSGQTTSEPCYGWGQIAQTGSNSDQLNLTFPLNEEKTYLIARSDDSDFMLPSDLSTIKLLVHVKHGGKTEIENVSNPASLNLVTLNENMLKSGVKVPLVEKMNVQIGSQSLTFNHIDSPGSAQFKVLMSTLQCASCFRYLENAQSFSCQHVFCQSCVTDMRKNAVDNQQKPGPGSEKTMSCPVCRKSLQATERTRQQKILSEVSKQFQDMLEDRPVCALCSNQRWLLHGSDYYFCEKCRNVYCPLCTLEFHKEHPLRSMYSSTLDAARSFSNKTAQSKQDVTVVLKQIEENKGKIRRAAGFLENLRSQLKRFEQSLDDEIKPTMAAFGHVQRLQSPRMDVKVDSDRAEAMKSFLTHLNSLKTNTMPKLILSINAKLNAINRGQDQSPSTAPSSLPESKTSS